MTDDIQQQRTRAVKRFLNGEKAESICSSLGRSRAWLYKWLGRYLEGDPGWGKSRSQRPLSTPTHTPIEIEEIVKLIRLNLYNRGLFCGAQAIRWEMEEFGVQPLPSIRTINRIISRYGLTHRRTGVYEPKGKVYPKLPSLLPNQTHQADWVGPCYLKGPLRFYSLNGVDLAMAAVVYILQAPNRARMSSTPSGQYGNAWAYRTTSKWTMRCLFSAAQLIPAAWGR